MSSSSRTARATKVPRLSTPLLPADHGFTSLGLLMQIGGSVFLGIMIFVGLAAVYAGMLFFSSAIDLIIIAVLSAARSSAHVAAGRALVHGSNSKLGLSPFAATRRYIGVALGHTVICALLVYDLVDDFGVAMSMGATWAAWPVTLWLVLRQPEVQALDSGIPRAEDHGFEGASVFMLLFGVIGSFFAGLALYQFVELPARAFSSFESFSVCAIFGVLLVRSVLHFLAGRQGIAGQVHEVSGHIQRYTRFAVLATIIVGVLLFVSAGKSEGSFLMVFLVAYLLLAWPRIISSFMDQSEVDRYISGRNAATQRAPDMGLTALGWLLLAISVHGLAGQVADILWSSQGAGVGFIGLLDTAPLSEHFQRSVIFSVLVSATQLWAAISLVRMNNDYQLAPMVYGVVGTACTLYTVWPLFSSDSLLANMLGGAAGMGGVTILAQVGMALTLPLSAFMLVRRRSLAVAQARFRSDDDRPQAS